MSLADLPLFEMQRASSLAALVALVGERNARGLRTVLYAGGTDWMVEQELRPTLPKEAEVPLVVDVSRMDELRGVRLEGETLRIGAAATYLEIRRSPVVLERAPLLARVAEDVGAIQIQARGTLGGNLATASPAADGVAALAAYDAVILVESVRGVRRIPMRELQTGYKQGVRAADEVIVAVEIALPAAGSPWLWRKVGARRAQAISKVALAGVAEVTGGRVGRFGVGMASVAPVTALLPSLRSLALGKDLAAIQGEEVDRAIEADITPLDDVRSTGRYRLHCAKATAREFLRALGASV